ncbi:hypothetical protein, partial [Streptococcus pneumoniae]|uniref:hypothetical protein n=1 Tax=Streptococcus pneumoniae TaxID=1313 RepID=UPI001662516E
TDLQMIEVLTHALRGFGFDTTVEIRRPHTEKPVRHVRIRGGLHEYLLFFNVFDPAIERKRNIEAQALKSEAEGSFCDG